MKNQKNDRNENAQSKLIDKKIKKAIHSLEVEDEPKFDSAGFSIEDRMQDWDEDSHHCDDLDCNCSI
jgi:hypothetical protein